jgi:5-methyltetrahydropteroyltriglutamate--homocysteine methyltransferase
MSVAIHRAQTIGSMLRSALLREGRQRLRQAAISHAEFKRIEDQAVDHALAIQERAGIDLLTDGEQRRASFLGSLLETTEGLSRDLSITKPWRDDDEHVTEVSLGLVVTGKLRRVRSMVCEEYAYARARSTRPIKVTLPSPMMLLMFWAPKVASEVYRDVFDLFIDGAEVIRAEIAELARMGCEHIQIDAPELAILIDPAARSTVFERNGIDPMRILGEGMELLDSLASAPGVSFGLHLCRGNNDGRWLSKGGYEPISKHVFPRANRFTTFLLEYDDARSGGFEPLADIPRDKLVVLGLVSTKRRELESAQVLVERIEHAARYFPRDQLGISPQCGFASGIKGNPVDEMAQERKLQLVGDVAHRLWPT